MNLFKNPKESLEQEKQILFNLDQEIKEAESIGDENRYRILKKERGFSHLLVDLMEVELKEQEIIENNNSQLNGLLGEIYG